MPVGNGANERLQPRKFPLAMAQALTPAVHQLCHPHDVSGVASRVDLARRPIGGGDFQRGFQIASPIGIIFQRLADDVAKARIIIAARDLNVAAPAKSKPVASLHIAQISGFLWIAQTIDALAQSIFIARQLARFSRANTRRMNAGTKDLHDALCRIAQRFHDARKSAGFRARLRQKMRQPFGFIENADRPQNERRLGRQIAQKRWRALGEQAAKIALRKRNHRPSPCIVALIKVLFMPIFHLG